MLEKLIGGAITILIGASLLPAVANQVKFFEGTNLIGWTIDKKEKSRKQTYLDYVKERLEVERLMK